MRIPDPDPGAIKAQKNEKNIEYFLQDFLNIF
jgi:hypothetical protein